MVLPLVPVVVIGAGVVSGASGVVLGLKGGYDIRKAQDRIREAGERYDEDRRTLEAREAMTNETLQSLGSLQAQSNQLVVDRMVEFLRRHEKQVSESEKLLVDGLELTAGRVALEKGLGQDAVSWMRGIAGSAVAGVGVSVGTTTAVTTFAAASTGTAISSLSGAAATNATLAFLGGGSIASGGGGMVVGAAALNVVAIGPAFLVGGLVAGKQGEKAKTEAREREAAVNVAIAETQSTIAEFDAIVARVEELKVLLEQLVVRGTAALDQLESEPFDPVCHAFRFQQALALTFAVRDVALAQVVDESGDLNDEISKFSVRYRPLIEESEDV